MLQIDPEILKKLDIGKNNGELVVIGGRPAVGKTTLIIELLKIIKANDNTLFFSLDSTKEMLNQRFNCNDITIIAGKHSIEEIQEKCSQYSSNNNISLIVIDYLQLLIDEKNEDSIIGKIRTICDNLNCDVVVLSELGRNVENNDDKKPSINDFNYYNIIELADKVFALYLDDKEKLQIEVIKK